MEISKLLLEVKNAGSTNMNLLRTSTPADNQAKSTHQPALRPAAIHCKVSVGSRPLDTAAGGSGRRRRVSR